MEEIPKYAPLTTLSYSFTGSGSSLDTVPEDTEETAHLYLLYVSWIHFQTFLLMVSVSKYVKDTEDTGPYVSVS